MINVAALTTGKSIPSARFRLRQHFKPMRDLGINVQEYLPRIAKGGEKLFLPFGFRLRYFPIAWPQYLIHAALKLESVAETVVQSRGADILWLERGLFLGCPTFERFLKHPFVFDVDDAIWHGKPFGKSQAIASAKRADHILAGNAYLADWFSKHNKNITVVPTSIDGEKFFPQQKEVGEEFVIGWTGSCENYRYLFKIREALLRFFEKCPFAKLLIIGNKTPDCIGLPPDRIEYHQWTEDNEAVLLRRMDIGIMPLDDNDWTRGKCAFKLIQYMASGLPSVVSPVGMNREVLSLGDLGFGAISIDDWVDAFMELYTNRQKRFLLGSNGRKIFERHYSRSVVTNQISLIFKSIMTK